MKLINQYSHFLLENVFPDPIIAGFSTPVVSGKDPRQNILKIVPRESKGFGVAWCSQPHGAEIAPVETAGIFPTDGLLTRSSRLVLVIRTADCLPLFLYDSHNDHIGLFHLGWKSLDKGIVKTLSAFLKDRKTGKIKLVAGPGLRKCCYEVKDDFLATSLAQFVEQRKGKHFFDPIRCVQEHLKEYGLAYDFHDTGICTLCDSRRFHSYRRDKTDMRILSFIMKK